MNSGVKHICESSLRLYDRVMFFGVSVPLSVRPSVRYAFIKHVTRYLFTYLLRDFNETIHEYSLRNWELLKRFLR